MSYLMSYVHPILNALLIFPFVAALFTVPYLIVQYRRFGAIPMLRSVIVYSFILYMMCAFFLTILPLPSIAEVRRMPYHAIQWIPFYDPYKALKSAGFSIHDLSTLLSAERWKAFLTSSGLFQILANIIMQVPLGIYLRYYFKRNWKQTLVIGAFISLFYEVTQFTGLYYIYPQPYRYCEMDDLINNTLGTMIGYWVAPMFMAFLPTPERLDELSYDKGERITLIRRIFAVFLDWSIIFGTWMAALILLPDLPQKALSSVLILVLSYAGWFSFYFIVLQWAFHGHTLGKVLLRLKVVDSHSMARPTLKQLLIRYALLYSVSIPLIIVLICVLATLPIVPDDNGIYFMIGSIAMAVLITSITLIIMIRSYRNFGCLPHRYYSHTTVAQTPSKRSRKLAPNAPPDTQTPSKNG